ncbi:unnamed protein product [Auanema sp. JU1783]|nr:unnamed protein product [Auanema sp. JU1783]
MEEVVRMGYGICEKNGDDDESNIIDSSHYKTEELRAVDETDCETIDNAEEAQALDGSTDIIIAAPEVLQRAISTDSLDSSCSLILTRGPDNPTAHLLLSFEKENQMLSIKLENLTDVHEDLGQVWLLFFLLPHPKPLWRTEAKTTPSASIDFGLLLQQCVRVDDMDKIALLVQLYSSKNQSARIAGQCRLRIKDIDIMKSEDKIPIALTLKPAPVYDENSTERLGDVLTLINHQNDTLTIIVSKLRELKPECKNVFVRVYLALPNSGVYMKKKTRRKFLINGLTDLSETFTFNISRKKFKNATIRLSMVCDMNDGSSGSIGHITISRETSGKELGHYSRAYSEQQNTLATWHSIQPRRLPY